MTLALFARLEAKPGKEKEVADFLHQGLTLANQEATTLMWFALRVGPPSGTHAGRKCDARALFYLPFRWSSRLCHGAQHPHLALDRARCDVAIDVRVAHGLSARSGRGDARDLAERSCDRFHGAAPSRDRSRRGPRTCVNHDDQVLRLTVRR